MIKTHLDILLADDDTDDCIFFTAAVDELKLSHLLTVVHDGEQLMQMLSKDLGNDGFAPLPDVLFLDLNMPRKNGRECLQEIKSSEHLKALPVIMFSTSFEQEVVNLLYKNGAQYFIRKPADFSQFKKIIQQTLLLMAKKNISQPNRENFVLTVQNSVAV
ncbi:MAG: response regulator [Bacteroidetes bacterium]|nr:response regulator [Bacteroidota bacterium]